MTGTELQSRLVRRVEAHYDATLANLKRAGIDDATASSRALKDALRVLSEALGALREKGLFPFHDGAVASPSEPDNVA